MRTDVEAAAPVVLPFADRKQAGRALARRLAAMAFVPPVVVLALPRGGVPIGAEVARALGAPLDLLLVRKIGAPGQPELAVAAVAEGEAPHTSAHTVIDPVTSAMTGADSAYVEAQAREQLVEIARRRRVYLQGRPAVPVEGATVIVVDDGIATGTTVRAALQALRLRRPARLVLAVPVAPPEARATLGEEVDEFVCLAEPSPFHAIGLHYRDFHQVGDEEVRAALDAAPHSGSAPGAAARETPVAAPRP